MVGALQQKARDVAVGDHLVAGDDPHGAEVGGDIGRAVGLHQQGVRQDHMLSLI